MLFIALTVAGLFILRRNEDVPVFKTPLYPFTPIVYLLLSAGLLYLLASGSPKQALYGALVVAAGLPFYYLVFRRGAAAKAE